MTAEPSRELIGGEASTELSANRTSLSFERTRMAADRTLMAIVRTSLSLISFGFTIYQVAQKSTQLFPADSGGRRLGMALLVLGVLLLIMGIASHGGFDRELGRRRERLYGLSLLHRSVQYHATPTYIVAVLLLLIGLLAIGSIAFRLV